MDQSVVKILLYVGIFWNRFWRIDRKFIFLLFIMFEMFPGSDCNWLLQQFFQSLLFVVFYSYRAEVPSFTYVWKRSVNQRFPIHYIKREIPSSYGFSMLFSHGFIYIFLMQRQKDCFKFKILNFMSQLHTILTHSSSHQSAKTNALWFAHFLLLSSNVFLIQKSLSRLTFGFLWIVIGCLWLLVSFLSFCPT